MATPAPITSITLNRNSSEDITPQIPEHLYAWTDSSGITYYAWSKNSNSVYYTLSVSPQVDDEIYAYTASTGQMGYFDRVSSVNENSIYVPDEGIHTRDSSKDITIYDTSNTLYAWTIDPEDIKNFFVEFPFLYMKDGQYFTLPDNTIYTKTPIVDTSTNVYYLVDNTELAITNIHFSLTDPYDSDGIVSADASTITIEFSR